MLLDEPHVRSRDYPLRKISLNLNDLKSIDKFKIALSSDHRWSEVNNLLWLVSDPNIAYNIFITTYRNIF